MEPIHERLMEHGSLRAQTATRPLSDLRQVTPVAEYVLFGVMPELVVSTQGALVELAGVEVSAQERPLRIDIAFQRVVKAMNSAPVRKRAARNIHLLGLAHHYGVRFAGMRDVAPIFAAIHNMMGPAMTGLDKVPQKTQFWNRCGQMLAHVGEHMSCDPVPEVLPSGLTIEAFTYTLELMVRLRVTLPMCKLLALGGLIAQDKIDTPTVCRLLMTAPDRVDDMIALLIEGSLDTNSARVLLGDSRLLSILSLPAMSDLLAFLPDRAQGQEVMAFAQVIGEGLFAANQDHQIFRALADLEREEAAEAVAALEAEAALDAVEPEEVLEEKPEQEPVPKAATPVVLPPFDHTRLNIATYVTGKFRLEAVQVWLVFGVLQPEERVSSMMTGSQVSQVGIEALCAPHFTRLGINTKDKERAWSFLTMGQVLERIKSSRRVRFNRELRGNPRTVPIVQALLELNSQTDRP